MVWGKRQARGLLGPQAAELPSGTAIFLLAIFSVKITTIFICSLLGPQGRWGSHPSTPVGAFAPSPKF